MSNKVGIVAGSFDPITKGHLWLICQASRLVQRLHVVIGVNPAKKYEFTTADREYLVFEAIQAADVDPACEITVVLWDGLLVTYAKLVCSDFIIRGIRSVSDYEYEQQIQQINRDLEPSIETLFLIPPSEFSVVSSSTVKSLVGFPGWEDIVSKYAPPNVVEALRVKRNLP